MVECTPPLARQLGFLLLLCAVLSYPALVAPRVARAQGDEAAAPDAKAAAAPPAGSDQVQAAPQKKSTFWWFIESSGFIGAVILVLSIYFVSTVTRLFIEMRQKIATPPELVDELADRLAKREFKEIYALAKGDSSFLGRLLAAGISELPSGLAEARDSMERTWRRLDRGDGNEDQHAGRARYAGSDDRPAGHAQGNDRQLQRDRACTTCN